MARFDVRANLNRSSRERVPYLLELQTDLLAGLATRLVAPLVPAARFGLPASRLPPQSGIAHRFPELRHGYRAGGRRPGKPTG